jgi:hypothetical protein
MPLHVLGSATVSVASVGVSPTESLCPGEHMRPRMFRSAPLPTASSLFNKICQSLADGFLRKRIVTA